MSWAAGGGAPGVVLAAAQLDVHADAGEGDAAGADAGALELLEHQQLRGEVAGLRAEDGDRVAARGVLAGDQQGVGHAPLLGAVAGAGQRALGDDAVVVHALQRFEAGRRLDRGLRCPCSAAPVRSYTSGSGVTEPASGSAVPRALSGLPAYGNEVPSWTVRTASGSLRCAEGLPDAGALLDAVLLLGGEQRERGLDLAAAAAAEQAADDGGERDQVGQLEGLDLADVGDGVDLPGEDVLAREVAAVLGLLAVGVDAVDVGLRVVHRLLAARALGGPDPLDLGLEVRLGVRGLRPELLLQALVGQRAAGEGGQLAAADVPEEVHQPQPVLPGGEAGAELGAVAGGALDVRARRSSCPG